METVARSPGHRGRKPLQDVGDLGAALARLAVPVFVLGRDETVTWLNPAAEAVVGKLVGRRFTDAVAPESLSAVREAFARKLVGAAPSTSYEAVFVRADGGRVRGEVSSVPFEEHGRFVGVFGIVVIREPGPPPKPRRRQELLTPRQLQTLHLLARGRSTHQIAAEMGLSEQTVRNHVRAVLAKLGVHSRLEAVVTAHERGLV